MNKSHWQDYHRAWDRLTPPLRPAPEVVRAVREQLGPSPGRTLLLGVTPELADIAPDLVAMDRDVSMVMQVWPGNSAARRAMVGDWRRINFAPASFAACVGDGSLSGLHFPDEYTTVFAAIGRALQNSGKLVCRLYASPEKAESILELRDAAMSGAIGNFHAFKLRLGMALAASEPDARIGVDAIHDVFCRMWKDRAELSRLTGWSRAHIDTIDFYRGSAVAYSFPRQEQVMVIASSTFSCVRIVPAGGYELAERCPLLVAERR